MTSLDEELEVCRYYHFLRHVRAIDLILNEDRMGALNVGV